MEPSHKATMQSINSKAENLKLYQLLGKPPTTSCLTTSVGHYSLLTTIYKSKVQSEPDLVFSENQLVVSKLSPRGFS